MAAARAPLSARRQYPRVAVGSERWTNPGPKNDDHLGDLERFLRRTVPSSEERKDSIYDKGATDPFRHDLNYMGGHISIAPPEGKLELTLKDRRSRPLPSSLRPAALDILEKPLRCLDRGPPVGHPSDKFSDALAARVPPQPIPASTQNMENEFLETIEKAAQDGLREAALWEQYAKRAMELLITMPLEKLLRVMKAFVVSGYKSGDLYTHLGSELAREIRNESSTRICQVMHWLARAGLRDQTLMSLLGNECLLRLHDDFVVDMCIEVLNVHAKLETRNPRLVSVILRELMPSFAEFTVDQCVAVTPLCIMTVFSDQARVAYLSRCAELSMGLPVLMTKSIVLRQFRLLDDCLRLDYHQISLPPTVQLWLGNLRAEADTHDVIEPVPLSATEQDICRILREEMDVAVTPVLQDGIFTLHLVMGTAIIQVLDSFGDYYVTPAMGGQKLIRAETKLRHRLLWRRGWRVLTLDDEDWEKLTDDLYKKDLLEDLLTNGPR
eukprot:CAMPEP_0178374354 /NCGR_PEP_ID=MMETSP0689_2-20121128/2333_1 /TAXON_ID=160604 /ORGANISM="Amphidinium massartii, Strain CS-259" /LENGTH=496 /DNA_ID=CAMNT_0019994321 /DNA_START=45 /DNA_END=1531 /DNA_ORIENTATION=+